VEIRVHTFSAIQTGKVGFGRLDRRGPHHEFTDPGQAFRGGAGRYLLPKGRQA